MTSEIVEQFKQKYEAQAGHVYLADTSTEAEQILARLLDEMAPRCLAVGDLSDSWNDFLEAYCTRHGIRLLKPPFPTDTLPQALDEAQVGISAVSFGIAGTGTIVEISTNDVVRLISTLPLKHIALLRADTLVPDLQDAAAPLRQAFSENAEHCTVSFISGPSRTGDIEMRLTLGVHGPEESHVILLL